MSYYFSDYTTSEKLYELAKLSARRKVLLNHLITTEKFSDLELESLSCGQEDNIVEVGKMIVELLNK